MRRGFSFLVVCGALASACTAGGNSGRDAGRIDSGRSDAGFDGGRTSCDDNADCDDGFACTIESCVVGNVCEYTAFDDLCTGEGERCAIGRGCVIGTPTNCEQDADCQDGNYCNGEEQCIVGMCYDGAERTCNDGNDCTIDTCDEAVDGCRRETAPGCDGGMAVSDGGVACDPFTAERDYSGTVFLLPTQTCSGGLGGYTVDTLSFSSSGGTLTIDAGRFRLTQTPAPTGPTFDVSGSDGCASVRLTGTFDCSNHFDGTWSAIHSGGCSACGNTSVTVAGAR